MTVGVAVTTRRVALPAASAASVVAASLPRAVGEARAYPAHARVRRRAFTADPPTPVVPAGLANTVGLANALGVLAHEPRPAFAAVSATPVVTALDLAALRLAYALPSNASLSFWANAAVPAAAVRTAVLPLAGWLTQACWRTEGDRLRRERTGLGVAEVPSAWVTVCEAVGTRMLATEDIGIALVHR